MIEINDGGQTYRVGRLNTFAQLHVSRRLAPLVPTLLPAFLKVAKQERMIDDIAGTATLLQPFADALAGMKDADAEFVYGTCLAVVQRRTTPTTWAPVWNSTASVSMFDDMDLGVMTRLVLEVVQDSLGPFIRGLLTGQPEETPQGHQVAG